MSNAFRGWSVAQAEAHNQRIALAKMPRSTTAASMLADKLDKETKAKSQRIKAANGKSESDIQNDIESYLKGLGHQCWFTRSRMDKATTQRCGIPDFIIILRDKAYALEVKRPGCKETREQAGELLWFKLAGGTSTIVHSLAEVVQVLNGITRGGADHE